MHQPSTEPERKLLQAIGKSGPAPQGIAVLNSDGQVLDWVLMFDDDPSVLKFLDHSLSRFAAHPDGAKPFETGRYQRFPTVKRDPVPAHTTPVPVLAHGQGESCPADSRHAPGTVIAKVLGRRVDRTGRPLPAEVNQEDYAQDRFVIPPELQARLAAVLQDAGTNRVQVPDALAELWVGYAYLGMLDVRPLKNPAGAPAGRKEIELWLQADPSQPGWHRL
jgi:hypothetical protein